MEGNDLCLNFRSVDCAAFDYRGDRNTTSDGSIPISCLLEQSGRVQGRSQRGGPSKLDHKEGPHIKTTNPLSPPETKSWLRPWKGANSAGRPCQSWFSQTPVKHGRVQFVDPDAGNRCRIAGYKPENGPWFGAVAG